MQLWAATADTKVGIGTPTPASKLEVRNGEISSTGPTGGVLAANNPNNQSSRVVLDWFNDGAKHWPRIRYGGSGEGSANGFLIQGSGDATKFAVLQNGNVGIGTGNPGARLTVSGNGFLTEAGAARFDLRNTTSGVSYFQHSTDQGVWHLGRTGNTNSLVFGEAISGSSGVRFRIHTDGDVANLEVRQQLTTFGFEVRQNRMDLRKNGEHHVMSFTGDRVIVSNTFAIGDSSPGAAFVLCHTGFEPTGFSGLGDCGSSLRYKKNINAFAGGLSLLNRLRPVSFDWKANDKHDFGLVAEEVAEVEPLLVTYNKHGQVEGVKYERLGVVLINAIREQQAQIDELRRIVSTLEQQNKTLSNQLLQVQRDQ